MKLKQNFKRILISIILCSILIGNLSPILILATTESIESKTINLQEEISQTEENNIEETIKDSEIIPEESSVPSTEPTLSEEPSTIPSEEQNINNQLDQIENQTQNKTQEEVQEEIIQDELQAQETESLNVKKISNTSLLDPEYNFSYNFIPGVTTFEAFGGNTYEEDYWTYWDGEEHKVWLSGAYALRIESDSQKGKVGVIYHNIGTYKGKIISLKITVMDWDKLIPVCTCLPNNKKIYPGINFGRQVINVAIINTTECETVLNPIFKYEFIDESTGKRIDNFKTKMTFYGGSRTYDDESYKEYKKFTILNPLEVTEVNINSTSKYIQQNNSCTAELYYTWRHENSSERSEKDQNFYITFLINNGEFIFKYNHYTSIKPNGDETYGQNQYTKSTNSILLDSRIINRYSTPLIYKYIDKEKITEVNEHFNYIIESFIPDVGTDYYEFLNIDQDILSCVIVNDVKIYNNRNEDITDYFNIDTSNRKLRVTLKQNNNSLVYNNTIKIVADCNFNSSNGIKELLPYMENYNFVFPNLASISTERNTYLSNQVNIDLESEINFLGSIIFYDGGNSYSTRPDKYNVQLYANGELVYTKEIFISPENMENDNKTIYFTFEDLKKYNEETGEKINYTIESCDIDLANGDKYISNIQNGNNIYLSLTGTTSITINKTWEDNENKYNTRPDKIQIKMFKEEDVNNIEKYITFYSKYGFIMINNIENLEYVEINGEKFTREEENIPSIYKFTKRGKYTVNYKTLDNIEYTKHITVRIINGISSDLIDIFKTDNWTKTVNLDKYTKEGNKISYTIEELDNIKGYESTNNFENNIYTITNKIKTCNYRVEYYYDGNIDESLTFNGQADFGSIIDTYKKNQKQGYILEKEENLGLKIQLDGNQNVIRVYYIKTKNLPLIPITGGPGINNFILLGIISSLLGLTYLAILKNKQKNQTNIKIKK